MEAMTTCPRVKKTRMAIDREREKRSLSIISPCSGCTSKVSASTPFERVLQDGATSNVWFACLPP